jgi:hypothetical protein
MSRHPEDKRRYNEAARKSKDQIKRIKEETFQTYLQGLTVTADTDYSLWKATKRLKQPTQRIPPIRNVDLRPGPEVIKKKRTLLQDSQKKHSNQMICHKTTSKQKSTKC